MLTIRYVFTLAGLLFAVFTSAQISGRVVEVSPGGDTSSVPGAVLVWRASAVAANTDADGNFSLPASPGDNHLVISAVGYKTDTMLVKEDGRRLLLMLKGGALLNEVEVLYYSSGTEISSLNAIKTEVLTERSLMKAACCNLSESFETNPSIDVNFTDAVSGTKQIQMLGLSGQYAQITKENMPYLRGLASNYGLSFIPGTWIQSIQLSKGAGSVINGYESFTGQINTELQNPEKSDKLNFNAYANENGRNEYNLNLVQRLNPHFSIGLLTHMSYNPLVQDRNKDGFADIPTGRQYNVMNKYAYTNGKGFEAQFGGSYLKDTRSGGQFPTIRSGDSLPLYRIGIDNQKWELYSKTGFVFRKRPATSMGLQLSYLDHEQVNFYGIQTYSGLQKTFYANYIFQSFIGNTNNSYKAGASFLNDGVKESFNLLAYKRQEQAAGTFLEFAHSYSQKLNLVAGIRADYHNYYGLFFTPRLHLRYAPSARSIFRLSGGRALRTANIFSDNAYLMASARTWNIETNNSKLPYGLKPEIGWNYGLNFTQKFKVNYREAYITLDAYRTDFSSQVVTDVDKAQQVLIYNLKGLSYSNTLQFEFNIEPRKRFFIKTAYRYVDTKVTFQEGLHEKTMVAKHRAFLNLSYETKNSHFQFDFTAQYNGAKRLPVTENNPIAYQRPAYSPGYFNVLSQLTYLTKIKKAELNIYLGVENLLNYKQSNPIVASDAPFSKYFDASMVWGPVYGRMLYAGVRMKIK